MLSEILNQSSSSSSETKKESSTTKYPYTTSIVADGRRKFHTTYKDGEEMVEEFDLNTNQLLVRKRRRPTVLGGEGEWHFEIGGDVKVFNPFNDWIAPSTTNPIFMRKDTSTHFQWRIRNCFFTKDTYRVNVDHEKQEVVISTTNKKYYKRFNIPELVRECTPSIKLEDQCLSWTLDNNTLIISVSTCLKNGRE
ncbi:hypothetical protein C9374_000856 [Naegleria lovaniensis]|uniref:Protein DPCD n=1 Tax=Naegleria lovaniensis TaxID=51637 RepID=A0AA88GTB0_NAELO|nr:uncharacterized protein C9374_000856 [Naegleria lovaniensis]KAG2388006.1 hypothetical protein C9374_000856 [Naegleria lovaniensis]